MSKNTESGYYTSSTFNKTENTTFRMKRSQLGDI